MATPHLARTRGDPVVGHWYLVPCVRGQWYDRVADWPVLGTLHIDAQFFNFHPAHYHIDARFLRGDHWPFAEYRDFDAFLRVMASPLQTSDRINPEGLPRPVLRRRRCVFARFDASTFRDRARKQMAEMARAFPQAIEGRHGWVCPHQNFDMRNISPDAEGNLTCPMHGLRFCARTGRCVDAPDNQGDTP